MYTHHSSMLFFGQRVQIVFLFLSLFSKKSISICHLLIQRVEKVNNLRVVKVNNLRVVKVYSLKFFFNIYTWNFPYI